MPRSKNDYSRSQPEYKSPTVVGAALTAVPPFSFHNVTARVFPLAANISALSSFVDSYINMDVPKKISYFQPALPYVYLVMLDYGDMSVDVGKRFLVSQREVSFAVPLKRFRANEDGTLEFQDFALVHPFIYVDDEWSLETGREVYGWPKVLASMDTDINLWTKDPVGRTKLLSMSAGVYPKTYANQVLEKRTFLEVYADPPPSFSQVPGRTPNPLNPLTALQGIMTGTLQLATNVTENLLRLNVRGFDPTSTLTVMQQMLSYGVDRAKGVLPEALLAQFGFAGANSPTASTLTPRLMVNNVNLKQFRDAQNPDLFCYQELNYSVMGANRVNRAGLLGDYALARGDLSGGFHLILHQYASQPIVPTLGLEVYETAEADGVTRAVLKPIMPFWCDMEFHYGAGRPLCWRTAAKPHAADASTPVWHANRRGETPVCDDAPLKGAELQPPTFFTPDELRGADSRLNRGDEKIYNATRGAALQAVPGPFDLPDVTVRVFPLLAGRGKLQKLCDDYLNTCIESTGMRFEPFGKYVYLTATNYGTEHGTMWSETNNIGVWRERAVAFQVPVKWYKRDPGSDTWRLVNVAMLSPFSFANTSTHVASDRELNGKRTEKASISCPSGSWMDESGPVATSRLLNLSAELLPALGLGQKTVTRTLVEVVTNDVLRYNEEVGWRFVSETWGTKLAKELRRKIKHRDNQPDRFRQIKALALRFLAGRSASVAPFNEIILKQCRDSSDPLHACFQSLLVVQSWIKEVYDVREIEDRVHVAIHEYPSHPIVETLGLQVKRVDNRGDSVVQYIQPIRPFWMRVGMKESLAQNVCRREGGSWETPRLPEFRYAKVDESGPALIDQLVSTVDQIDCFLEKKPSLTTSYGVSGLQSGRAPQRVHELLEHADAAPVGTSARILEPAVTAPGDASHDAIEPQLVLESLLSDEWENWGNPRWYRRTQGGENVQQKPDFYIPSGTIGASGENRIFQRREHLNEVQPGVLVPVEGEAE